MKMLVLLDVHRERDQLLINSIYTFGKSIFLLLECVLKAFQLSASNVLIQRAHFLSQIFSNIDQRLKHRRRMLALFS